MLQYIGLILFYEFGIGKLCSNWEDCFLRGAWLLKIVKGIYCPKISLSGKAPVSELAPLSSSKHMVMFCFRWKWLRLWSRQWLGLRQRPPILQSRCPHTEDSAYELFVRIKEKDVLKHFSIIFFPLRKHRLHWHKERGFVGSECRGRWW